MSAQIESLVDSYVNAANQNKNKNGNPSKSDTASSFSNLLKERLSGTVAFSRIENQLAMPTAAANPEDQGYRERPTVERPKSDEDRRAPEAATATAGYEERPEHAVTPREHAPKANTAAERQPHDQPADKQPAAKAATPDQQAAAGTNAKTANVAAKPANAAAQPQQVLAGNATGAPVAEAARKPVETDMTSLNTDAKKTTGNIKATVTSQAAQVTSQPTNNLAAGSNMRAEIAQQAKTTTTGAGDMTGDMTGDMAKGTPFEQVDGNNVAAKVAKAKAGTAEISAAKKPAFESSPQTGPQPPALNFNNAAAAAVAQTSAGAAGSTANMPGNSGQVLTVDAATGGTSVMGQNGSVQRGTHAASARSHGPNVPAKVIADQVAVNIQRAAGSGQDQITLQLRPSELGRVEVKMEMGQDGRMTAIITADKPETLDLLRNDARTLVQSLNDAGLQTDANSLSFNLKSQNGDAQQETASKSNGGNQGDNEFSLDGDMPAQEEESVLALGEDAVADENGRMNIRV
ncbi:flagellar hook-length control protein FliK [Aestuariispira insulae]|uniref:Flagellar hook-length control protein FliK n=1 Tax=Aestuariispira insulae TaxID=1461337 RepID=A0A3D9HSJ5_9PROT|nr:flagellar hook-length control protein FliK [Aestuariispira insulae]RED52429.1 flagellar hook-length control protein FliK [Aestuariispira insulae]